MNVRSSVKLVLIASLALCFACSGPSARIQPPGATEPEDNPAVPESAYDPPIQLSFVRETGDDIERMLTELPGETLEDNRWTKLYMQELGIRTTYEWTAKGDVYNQKLGVSLASGRIPDVVQVDPYQLRLLANAGLIEDLTQTYDAFASPLTRQILTAEGSGPFDAATVDGRLMAIPESVSSIESAQYLWIRTDWLKRLGLSPPRTIEDVLAISRALTEEDPDQNGVNDTYGLGLTGYLWNPVLSASGFMAGFGAFPTQWVDDGKGGLVYGGILPETRKALQSLQDMYRAGQIDPDFGYKSGGQMARLIAQGKIGMLYGEQWTPFTVQQSRERDPDADWQAYPLPAEAGREIRVPLRAGTGGLLAVRKGYEHPEALVKMMNLHLEKNWGKDADYETYYNDDSRAVWMLSPVTPFPGTKNLDAYREIRSALDTGNAAGLQGEAAAIQKRIEAYDRIGTESGWGWKKIYGPDGAFSIADEYERSGRFVPDLFGGGITETMVERHNILRDLQLEAYMNIILGEPIERFDQFVQDWKELGGDQITAEVNLWNSSKPSGAP
ncbi:ABC transporter substrate-binding protein [Saccharibacillus sp. O23]|uniref:extracellular solute-binding protein n=1 Tax=Saccharibacillus sp. O23 TaxID=2009338 RepID=UPI000B4E02E5|nr:extracellular solute-binding protein [Saccharibacillus sp. O23]OWR28280.1 ABC transporter substrate-binding protein [Saccharibacillus sp. O23]